MTVDGFDFGPVFETGEIDINAGLRDAMAVVRVALSEDMPQVSPTDAVDLLTPLLRIVRQRMPSDLQAQDPRVLNAEALLMVLQIVEA